MSETILDELIGIAQPHYLYKPIAMPKLPPTFCEQKIALHGQPKNRKFIRKKNQGGIFQQQSFFSPASVCWKLSADGHPPQ
jgi:hypothetical protein